jgi:carboxynorspermidine decarboxylase
MKWVNFGGGHHISRQDYDLEKLCRLITDFRKRFNNIPVYLEPGEAIALDTGFLVAELLDIAGSGPDTHAILDTSATCHMPDVLEMPYRPQIIGAGEEGEKAHTYQLGGLSCLAGDNIGRYSFDTPLTVGDRLVFTDMAHYSMVKTNTFNGIRLPSIYRLDMDGRLHLEREFGYGDFKTRLG